VESIHVIPESACADVIANKLRDEAEYRVMNALYSAVLPQNIVPFSSDGTNCMDKDCDSRNFIEAMEEAAQGVYDIHKVWPNVIVAGPDAIKILRRGEFKVVNKVDTYATGVPASIAKNYLGVMDDRYALLYDPDLTGALIT